MFGTHFRCNRRRSLTCHEPVYFYIYNPTDTLLKTEAAIKLHVCAYDVDESIFSKSAMEEYLKTSVMGQINRHQ